ncbi:MAG: hypothetical protein AB8G95_15160 [Anaerolineae bacterium]
MNSLELIQNFTKQHNQRYEKLWIDILKMPDTHFNALLEPANLSVSDHIMLVIAEFNRWLGFLNGERDTTPITVNNKLFADPKQLLDLWNTASADLENYISSKTSDELNRTAEGIQGPIWEVLIHIIMFAEEHHGHIITILAQLDILPQTQRVNRDLWHFQPDRLPRLSNSHLISC